MQSTTLWTGYWISLLVKWSGHAIVFENASYMPTLTYNLVSSTIVKNSEFKIDRGRDRMTGIFITTYAISSYHH